tara:strand:- start:852 stop:1031 length:180 start_codon:yes stop_codon:yes gene_type:complete
LVETPEAVGVGSTLILRCEGDTSGNLVSIGVERREMSAEILMSEARKRLLEKGERACSK